jgi:hypothetical protein
MLMGKRIGKWSWALSAEERLTAVLVDQAHGDHSLLTAKLKRAHDGMLEKQRKLAARAR